MALEKKDVEHLAKLCNLQISAEEASKLLGVLSETFDYIDILNQLDTSSVSETYQVTGLKNVFREDGLTKSTLESKDALTNAKKVVDNKFATEAVFDRE